MRHPPRGPALATGILLSSLLVTALPASARQSSPDAIVQPDALSVQGQEIPQISTPRLHVTRGADGLVHVRVYLSPLGSPGGTSWQARDTTLSVQNADGTRSPAASPFKLRVAGSAGAATLAALTNEDGVGLRLNLGGTIAPAPAALGSQTSTVAGTGVIDVPGQVAGNVITYPAALAGGHQDLAVESAHEGVRLRLTARDAQGGATLAAAISLDHPVTFRQDPGGAIVVTRQIQGCGSTGCIPVDQPEYVIGPAVVTDASGAAPRTLVGAPATLRVASSSASGAQIAVSLDPAWLAAAGRAFPLAITVPVETAGSAVALGTEGSVSSCAPAALAAHGDLTVGTAGGCSYRGVLYFDMGKTILQSPIQAAALHLYAPGQNGPVAVQVFAGAPPAKQTFPTLAPLPNPASAKEVGGLHLPPPPPGAPASPAPVQLPDFRVPPRPAYQPPTDADVRSAAGAQGISAVSTNGPWQSWDVTGVVQNWISQGYAANGGFVLASDGAPVQLAGSRGTAEGNPALAPYLDLTLTAPPPASAAPAAYAAPAAHAAGRGGAPPRLRQHTVDFSDQVTTAGLASNQFLTEYACFYIISSFNPACEDASGHTITETRLARYANVSYVRSSPLYPPNRFICNPTTWDDPNTWKPIYNFMNISYQDGLIPVVAFLQDRACPSTDQYTPNWWLAMAYFAYFMPPMTLTTTTGSLNNPPMDFEIGNEVDITPGSNERTNWLNYPLWFGQAALGLQAYLDQTVVAGTWHRSSNNTDVAVPGHPTFSQFRVLTGGLSNPSVSNACDSGTPTQLTITQQALSQAASFGVSGAHLGVASHPYGYSIYNGRDAFGNFVNFFDLGGTYGGICHDLDQLIANWNYSYFPGYLHVTTEDNYSSLPDGTSLPDAQTATNLEGAYMLDLFTWLYWNLGADGQWGYQNNGVYGERAYPFNLFWFSGVDTPPGSGGSSMQGLMYLVNFDPLRPATPSADKITTFTPNCPAIPGLQAPGLSLRIILGDIDRVGWNLRPGDHC